MTTNRKHRSSADAKNAAKNLRAHFVARGHTISHSKALELVAKSEGFRDWNTFSAYLKKCETLPGFFAGDRIDAIYLGQPGSGVILKSEEFDQGRWHVAIQLDDPVDVVRFDSFSSIRSRISATIGADGNSFDHTSDGNPILRLVKP